MRFHCNCASNVSRKLVIVRGAAGLFPAYIIRAANSKCYGKPCYYKLIQYAQYALSEPCYVLYHL